jgi:hypothetical protein
MASYTHVFVVLCALQGTMGGVIWGWLHYGLLGAVLGTRPGPSSVF